MIRGVWNQNVAGIVFAASLLPVVAAMVAAEGAGALLEIAICGATVLGWQLLFRARLGVPVSAFGAVVAVALPFLAPAGTTYLYFILAASFGSVIGELVFGGWGRNFLSASVVGLAFLSLSHPAATFDPPTLMSALAVGLSGLLLLVTGLVSFTVLLAYFAGFAAVILLLGAPVGLALVAGSLAFSAVYMVGDPVAAAVTGMGRLVYGGLAGALAGLLMASGVNAGQSVVFAALLASIFAPLIDQGAIAFHLRIRKARNG